MSSHNSIKNLPRLLRPREKMASRGLQTLSTPELLAIIIGSGTKKENAITLSKRLLRSFDSLMTLSKSNLKTLTTCKGIGPVKASNVLAAFELGRRCNQEKKNIPNVLSPQQALLHVEEIRNKSREHLIALFVDARHQLIAKHVIAIGSLNKSLIDPRDIFFEALQVPCLGIILAHNHPSGDPTPSSEDVSFTKSIAQAGQLLGITVIDHLVVTKDTYTSMKESGVL